MFRPTGSCAKFTKGAILYVYQSIFFFAVPIFRIINKLGVATVRLNKSVEPFVNFVQQMQYAIRHISRMVAKSTVISANRFTGFMAEGCGVQHTRIGRCTQAVFLNFMEVPMCSWQCGGCGIWYPYSVSSCECSKLLHIKTTGGTQPASAQQGKQEICPECGGEVLINVPSGNGFCLQCDYHVTGKLLA